MRLADTAPPRCASCYDQKTDARHVDFEASYDGPVIPGADPLLSQAVSVDDLIICEGCLREAARLIGLEDWADLKERAEAAEAQAKQCEDRLLTQAAYVQDLERAVASKPKPAARKKAATA